MEAPFVCVDCEEPKPLYQIGMCKECWLWWQEYIRDLAEDEIARRDSRQQTQ